MELIGFLQIAATLLVAFLLHRYTKRMAAMDAANRLRDFSDPLWDKIEGWSNRYKELTPHQRDVVAKYLNEYEQFCALYNQGVIDRKIAKLTRGQTVFDCYNRYKGFIESWRNPKGENKPDAWEQLVRCAPKCKQGSAQPAEERCEFPSQAHPPPVPPHKKAAPPA